MAKKKILVTGAAGFIGAALTKSLLKAGYDVVGIDNLNEYYDPSLKIDRLQDIGIDITQINIDTKQRIDNSDGSFGFYRIDIQDTNTLKSLFSHEHFDIVVNLAAQAGARYSVENPATFISNNIQGFVNILDCSRLFKVEHVLYASSSSVYGLNQNSPNCESDRVDTPVSIYGATKRCDELLAHVYSHLYGLPTTGMRLFTVYGPWGRPDMSPFIFINAILKGEPLKLFNEGKMKRDFTYIDDIVEGITRLLTFPNTNSAEKKYQFTPTVPYRIVNIGNSSPVSLLDYISEIETSIGKKAFLQSLPMQPGDVLNTYCDPQLLLNLTGFAPSTPLSTGIAKTIDWYRKYYNC